MPAQNPIMHFKLFRVYYVQLKGQAVDLQETAWVACGCKIRQLQNPLKLGLAVLTPHVLAHIDGCSGRKCTLFKALIDLLSGVFSDLEHPDFVQEQKQPAGLVVSRRRHARISWRADRYACCGRGARAQGVSWRPKRRMTSRRLRTWSLVRMLLTWFRAVIGEMTSRSAICWFVRPRARSPSTSCSRSVSP